MNLLQFFIASPWAGAIGWALLHSLWEGAIISGVLGAALAGLRSPRARYVAACAAMLAMLAAFGVTLARMMPESTHSTRVLTASALPAWNVPAAQNAPIAWGARLTELAPWLALIWTAGVLLIFFRYSAGCFSVQKLRRHGVCCASDCWQKQLARLRVKLRITRPVTLLESCLADVPVVLGHLRPIILMPAGLLAGLPPEQIEAILLHELAHIRRHDYLVNMFQRFVEGLFFYHPAVWWFSRLIRAERENCCDDMVVSTNGNAQEYALALTALEESRSSSHKRAVAATGGNLAERIHRLLYPRPNGALAPFLAAAILIAMAAVSLAAWQAKPHPSSSSAAQSEKVLPPAYSKWIGRPVSYLMTPPEKLAFFRLTTNTERDTFIEQFWARRNPNPGSSDNVFKEEFYRRVSYADEHFASGIPGWSTDRGRFYIMYGPPNEIERHGAGGLYRASPDVLPPGCKGKTVTYPFEDWFYNYIPGIGQNVKLEFFNPTSSGEYHLAFSPCDKYVSRSAVVIPIVRSIDFKGLTIPIAMITPRLKQIGLSVMQPYDQKKAEEAKEKIKEVYQQRGIAVNVETTVRPIPPDSVAVEFVISE